MEAVVEVFRTNVEDEQSANEIISRLLKFFPDYRINFDLDDCDRILRVEGETVSETLVSEVLQKMGFTCEVLDDVPK